MKKSLRKRFVLLIFCCVLLLNLFSIFMNYQNFATTTRTASNSAASTVAETCALIIDGDSVGDYSATHIRDSAYYATWNKLIDYRNTNPEIISLSLMTFDENGGTYIYDTDLTPGSAFLGDWISFNQKQLDQKDILQKGNDPVSLTYNDRVEYYRPILSSFNMPMGYVVVGISTLNAKHMQMQYLIRLTIIMTALTLCITAFFVAIINRTIITPINRLSSAVSGYLDSMNESGQSISPLSQFSIHTGDEIEHLYHSIRKMESDILNSSNNLSVALWNSQHDSMTQLYNKRYLEECTYEHESRDSLGIIYFDVDNLKKMNDICGHECGDRVIIRTADFIRSYLPENSAAFRMGGDEFMMLLPDITENTIQLLVQNMKADPKTNLSDPDQPVKCRIAIGYAYGSGNIDLNQLISEADQNMYLDKQSHR